MPRIVGRQTQARHEYASDLDTSTRWQMHSLPTTHDLLQLMSPRWGRGIILLVVHVLLGWICTIHANAAQPSRNDR